MWLIILNVIKIIGIILLCVIALVLLVLLLVLFAPIRYRLNGYKEDDYLVKASFSWLGIILHGKAEYDGEFIYSVKALLFTLAPKKEKEVKASKSNNISPSKAILAVEDNSKKATEEITNEIIEEDKLESDFENIEVVSDDESINIGDKPSEVKKRRSIVQIFTNWVDKLQYTFKSIYAKIVEKGEWLNAKIAFLNEDRTKQAFLLVFHSIKNLLKHIVPRKGYADIYFGFEDPSVTGKAVAAYSVFYPFLGKVIKIYPDFQNPCFYGRFDMKGKVRVFTILLIAIKLYFNKNFRYLKNNLFD